MKGINERTFCILNVKIVDIKSEWLGWNSEVNSLVAMTLFEYTWLGCSIMISIKLY